ncbi:MAG: PAS domain S-box protein [Deltaproteobacteria bacterium]|nr:PAS domain S-box protein [Deltaproteobacteria bacterium]
MADDIETLRIAIIVDREAVGCLPLLLPFSVAGYPQVQIEFFQAASGPKPGLSLPAFPQSQPEAVTLGLHKGRREKLVRPVAELQPEDFNLILDWQNRVAELPGIPPEALSSLVTGPGTPLLERVLCQLQELRQKFEVASNILLSATDGIVTINEDHQIIGYNYGAEKIFGYPREEALGKDLSILIPPPHKDVHKEYVRRFIATREARVIGKHMRLNAQRRDGSEFPMSISFSVAEIQGNLYFTGIVRDITEYQEMEDRLLASERLAAIGNTVAHIAHEIKNPLLIIGGFAHQLEKVPGLDDKSRQKLAIIGEEVERLEAMVAEMRDFVRPPELKKTWGNLEAAVDDTLEFFQETFKERQIEVRRVKEGPMPQASFDPRQIRQVLINLFKNALEAMPRGGVLTVASRVKDGNIEVSVGDTGEGMSAEVAAHIFQPYYTTKEKGTGLGLAICQFIVEHQHGGCILVDSAPGQGSTFTIQIPREEAGRT